MRRIACERLLEESERAHVGRLTTVIHHIGQADCTVGTFPISLPSDEESKQL